MKNLLPTIGLAIATCLVSCGTEIDPSAPTTDEETTPQAGVYQPQRIIENISTPDGEMELWLWKDSLLSVLADGDLCGGYNEKCWFYYDKQRLMSMQATVEDMVYTANYSYDGSRLSSVKAESGGYELLKLGFAYDSEDKISNITISPDPILLNWFSSIFDLPQLTYSVGKATVSDVQLVMALIWSGDNVSQQVTSGSIDATLTLGEVKQLADLESALGDMASMINLLPDSTQLPLHITFGDTASYTFDNHPNPRYGLLYQPDVALLCHNNILSEQSHGEATISTTISTPLGSMPLSFPYPMPARSNHYTYTYDAEGFPTDVMLDEEEFKTYTYQQ